MSEPEGRDLLVRGGDVLSPEGTMERRDVLIRGGTIGEIGRVDPPPDVPVVDATGCFILPGLINTHMHSGENFNPGLYENLPLDLWFVHSHEVTRSTPPSPEAIYTRTLLGALLMLRNGTTTAVDFLYESPEITPETLEAVVQAYTDIGMRATILLGVADKTFLESLPFDGSTPKSAPAEAAPPSLDRVIDLSRSAIERWHDPGGLIEIGLGPSAPQRCSEELLRATWELARDTGVVWHTHALETKTQAYTAHLWHGQSFVKELADRGFLGTATSIVHAVWLDDDDISLLAESGTTMIHCLLSNLRLGDGIARLPELMAAGVNVALGTDGRGCDETLDMIELIKMTALVHKVHGHPYEDWPTAAEALRMATVSASIATGHGEKLGRLEPGAAGDLIVINGSALALNPVNDPIRQIVYGNASRDIDTVVVNGRVIARGGVVQNVDPEILSATVRRAREEVRGTSGNKEDLKHLEQQVRGIYDRAEAAQLETRGYIRN